MKTIIPAQPGFNVLEFVKGDKTHPEHTYNREPVIAWVITLMRPNDRYDDSTWAAPVTASGIGEKSPAVENPHGVVDDSEHCWPSAAEWFKAQCEKEGGPA